MSPAPEIRRLRRADAAAARISPMVLRDLSRRAREIHDRAILVDGHCDTIGRAVDRGEDLSKRTKGHIDVPRMRAGGLDAQFFAFWIEPKHVAAGVEVQRTLQMLDALRRVKGLEVCRSAADVRRAARARRPAGIACIEGGHAIRNDLAVLRVYASLGIRYMTLTWNQSTDWADAAAQAPKHGGLTKFGREVVREMNRTGILVDLSHVHEKTFWAALETTRKPVIASHSSCRAICDHRRNLWDDQLRGIARNGGVVGINFYSRFLSPTFKKAAEALPTFKPRKNSTVHDDPESRLPRPAFEEAIDHVDHACRVAGVDHVGLGADFDGVSSLPEGIDGAQDLPRITEALLRRGYTARDLVKILGGNFLRVLEAND